MLEHWNRSANTIEIRGVNLRDQKRFVLAAARMNHAVRTNGKTLANITIVRPASADDEHFVFYGACRQQRLPLKGFPRTVNPCCRIHHDVATSESSCTRNLGESQIVADGQTELAKRGVNRLE